VFDEQLREYRLRNADGTESIVRYCFACGGMLPESRRRSLFEDISAEDEQAVNTVLSRARTASELLMRLGTPDVDEQTVQQVIGDNPVSRVVEYHNLCKSVDVVLLIGDRDVFHAFLRPKRRAGRTQGLGQDQA
jgi:hypothetical protein